MPKKVTALAETLYTKAEFLTIQSQAYFEVATFANSCKDDVEKTIAMIQTLKIEPAQSIVDDTSLLESYRQRLQMQIDAYNSIISDLRKE